MMKNERNKALLLSQNRNLQSENSSMRKQINEINGELNNVQVRENILKNQVQNQVWNGLLMLNIFKMYFRMLLLKSWKKIYCLWMRFPVHTELLAMGPHQLRQMFNMNFLKMLSREVLTNSTIATYTYLYVSIHELWKDVTQRSSALLQEIPQTSSESADPSLLAIVQSQRERFRLRVQELENENSQQSQNMQESYCSEFITYLKYACFVYYKRLIWWGFLTFRKALSMEIESLRMDNVKLYEKIKFLQNYRPNSGYQTNIDDEAGKKYASQYEGMCLIFIWNR